MVEARGRQSTAASAVRAARHTNADRYPTCGAISVPPKEFVRRPSATPDVPLLRRKAFQLRSSAHPRVDSPSCRPAGEGPAGIASVRGRHHEIRSAHLILLLRSAVHRALAVSIQLDG